MKHNVPVSVSLISPYLENREFAREIIGNENFIETYIKCSLDICEDRDVKGMYKKARNNEIKSFTGIDDPYDVPENPELIIETENKSLDDSVEEILNYLKTQGHLKS